MKTREQLNEEYDTLATPISKDVLANHYEHWCNFPVELFKMSKQWIEKLESLGYEMSGIKSLLCQLALVKEELS